MVDEKQTGTDRDMNQGYVTWIRRVRVADFLKRGGRYSIPVLKKTFGVAKNTMLNDMACLCACLPIARYVGRSGGYEFTGEREVAMAESTYRLLRREMEEKQVEFSEELTAALDKLGEWFREE